MPGTVTTFPATTFTLVPNLLRPSPMNISPRLQSLLGRLFLSRSTGAPGFSFLAVAIALLLTLAGGRTASAAVAILSSSSVVQNNNNNSSTQNLAYVLPAGNNRLVVVTSSGSGNMTDIVSVTCNGNAMTQAAHRAEGAITNTINDNTGIWYTVMGSSASTTAANITVTYGGNFFYIVTATGFSGVDQTTPVSGGTTNTSSSISVSSASGNMVIDSIAASGTAAAGGGQTLVASNTNLVFGGVSGGASTAAGASSVSMSWSGLTSDIVHAGASINQVATASPVTATQAIGSEILTQSQPSANFTPVTGSGGTGSLSYSVSPTLPTGLSISSTTGAITGSPTVTHAASTFTVTVTDSLAATATNTFSLTINSGVTAAGGTAVANLTQGKAATAFTPVTGSGGTGTLTYSISGPPSLPTGLSINPSTGTITGTPSATAVPSTYTVKVTDANSASASNTFILTVNPAVTATQAIASKTLTRGQPSANFTPVTGAGGTVPLSYGVAPLLPAGLSFDSTSGAITGSPTVTSGLTTYTVTVIDANSAAASNTFQLTINGAVTATQSVASKTLTQGTASPFTPVTGGGGTVPLSYGVSPPLPTGLSFDTTTGAITGAPTVTHAASTFTVTVTDANGSSSSNTFQLTINSAVTATQAIPAVTLTQNQPSASFTPVTGSGGTGSLSYSVSPPLPTGLTLGTTNGTITGSPTVTHAASTFTITTTDLNGATASNTFQLTINTAVTATQSVATKTLTQGHAASFTPITGGGGTAPLSYGVSPLLPSGLSFDTNTGNITGAPTVTLAATIFTVTVTDANSATASNTFQLTINSAVTATQAVASKALTQGTAATPFSPVTGAGGTGSLSYSVSPQLPTGLSLTPSTGIITGTPTVTSGLTTYTITVTDANGATAANTFSLVVNAAIVISPSTLPDGIVGVSYTHGVSTTGGTGAITFGFTGTLPTGLNLDSGTGAITGIPTVANTFNFTVTATDTVGATSSQGYTVNIYIPPGITLNPVSKTVPSGPQTTFTAGASGTPTPTVQWQASTDGGSNFNDLALTSVYSGVNTTTLTLTGVSTLLTGTQYRAVFTNGGGTATTTVATLTVVPQVLFTAGSETVNQSAGTFSVQVRLNDAPLAGTATVPFVLSGTAVAGTDYSGVTASPLVFTGSPVIAAGPGGATESGNTVTITTTAAHGFSTGQSVIVQGVGVAGYNGTFTLTGATATTFTYTAPSAGLAASGGGTATLASGSPVAIGSSPTGATEGGQTVTITTTAPHGFTTGQSVTIAGVGVAGYNGTFKVVGATAMTFTYSNPVSGLASSGGGTVTLQALPTMNITGTLLSDPGAAQTLVFTLDTPTNAALGGITTNTLTIVEPPGVTASTANLNDNAGTITINGAGFDSNKANDSVVFSDGVVGTITSATSTQLVVMITTPPTHVGTLTATVTVNGQTGPTVQVGTVVPVPGPVVISRNPAQPVRVTIATILANVFDNDATDVLKLVSIGTPANGKVQLSTTNGGLTGTVTYAPNAGYLLGDSFTYTVQDSAGTQVSNTVTVAIGNTQQTSMNFASITAQSDGSMLLIFNGVPNTQYGIRFSPSLTPPITWAPLTTVTTDGVGVGHYQDSAHIGNNGFYELVYPAP